MVAFDAASKTTGGSGTSITWSHTCTGANRVLVIQVYDQSNTLTGATYNGVAMTKIGSSNSKTMYYLANPSTGANNVVVSRSSSGVGMVGGAISFSGANPTNPIGNTQQQVNAPSPNFTLSFTTAYDNSIIIGYPWCDGTVSLGAEGSGHAERWTDMNIAGGTVIGTTQTTTTAGAKTLDFTNSGSDILYTMVVEVRDYLASGPANLKSYNTNLAANVKSLNTNLAANIKSINTNS